MSGGKRKSGTPASRPAKKSAPRSSPRSASRRPGKPGKPGTPGRKPRKPPKKPQSLARRRTMFALKWAGIVGLVLTLVAVGGFIWLYRSIDVPDKGNPEFETQTSFVYYNDGKGKQGEQIGTYAIQNRDSIGYDEMPQSVKDAVVAAENRSFWTDNGIDPKGILRALLNNASSDTQQGASTITQQYVKLFYLTTERSYTRKVKEAIVALKLVRQETKEEILQGYLNTIYFGRGAYGIQAAAKTFFAKDAKDLDVRESAMLASIINNPSRFDPGNGKDARQALKDRYAYVLDGMAEAEAISAEEAEEAAQKLPKLEKETLDNSLAKQDGHMMTMVKNELLRLTDENGEPLFTDDDINGGGLKITTTFTSKAMQAAEEGVAEARPEGFSDRQLHVGVASVEVGTGAVRGFYAGQDYLQSQLNWAVSGGQAGSSLKPFALAAGIRQGFELKDTFEGNSPLEITDTLDFENQGDEDYGSAVNLITATKESVNTAFVDLTVSMEGGPEAVVKQANLMGIPPEPDKVKDPAFGFPNNTPGLVPGPGVALGSATVSPINMANGYATIANGGRAVKPYIIESVTDQNGEVRYSHQVTDKMAMNEDIAADVSYALQQVVTPDGTGYRALELDRPAAAKTGTSTNTAGDVVSAWFTGYTPQLATSVVYVRGNGVGKLDGWLPEFFGGTYPAMTWTAVMQRAMEGMEVEDFPPPAYVTGEAPTDGHEPAPPSPTKKPSDKPSETESSPTEEPTTELPTQDPTPTPTPTPEPTPTPTPTDCGLLGTCETPSPTPTPTDTASPSESTAPRSMARTAPRRAWWMLAW